METMTYLLFPREKSFIAFVYRTLTLSTIMLCNHDWTQRRVCIVSNPTFLPWCLYKAPTEARCNGTVYLVKRAHFTFLTWLNPHVQIHFSVLCSYSQHIHLSCYLLRLMHSQMFCNVFNRGYVIATCQVLSSTMVTIAKNALKAIKKNFLSCFHSLNCARAYQMYLNCWEQSLWIWCSAVMSPPEEKTALLPVSVPFSFLYFTIAAKLMHLPSLSCSKSLVNWNLM